MVRNPFSSIQFARARRSCPRRCGSRNASPPCTPARVPQPSRMNSAASRHPDTPPIPEIGSCDLRVGRDLLHHVQRDRLHRRTAVAAVRRFAAHVRPRRQRIEIDARDRIDRVDRGQRVRAAALAPRAPTVRMSVMFGVSFTSTGVRATSFTHSVIMHGVLRHLPDGRLPCRARSCRAGSRNSAPARRRPRLPTRLHDLVPRLALRFHHQRSDHRVLRIALLHLRDLAQVDLRSAGR